MDAAQVFAASVREPGPGKTVADIFICYRHDDAPGYAGRLADALSEHFPHSHIFRDVEGLEAGSNFKTVITANLASCAAFLAVIGPRWLDEGAQGRSRLHEPDDFVRLEVNTALQRGTFLVPVLVGDADMPAEEQLPEDLQPLASRQACEVSDSRWDADVAALVEVLSKQPGLRTLRRTLTRFLSRRTWKWALAATVLSIAALVAVTRFTVRDEPALPAGLTLIDLDIQRPGTAPSCIKPRDCDTQDERAMSEIIRLHDAEIRFDATARQLHLLLDVRWTLRAGTTKLFHRGYTGKLYYAVDYQPAERGGRVVLGSPAMRGYSLSPVNGLLAYAFGWSEIPFLIERDDDLAAEMRRRLNESAAIQSLP